MLSGLVSLDNETGLESEISSLTSYVSFTLKVFQVMPYNKCKFSFRCDRIVQCLVTLECEVTFNTTIEPVSGSGDNSGDYEISGDDGKPFLQYTLYCIYFSVLESHMYD